MGRLQGKVAVVTGGSSGIGLATARRFAQEGAHVFIAGRRRAELDSASQAIGGHTVMVQADISNLADLDRLYDTVREKAGVIDVLFANAGGGSFSPLQDISEAHYDGIFAANVKGTLFTVQKALPLLRDGASIILTGSIAAVTGMPAFSVYSASKAAIRSFARGWILDLAPRHIRVNVLVPGATSTPGWHGLAASEEQDQEMQRQTAAATPAGRLGNADEIANAALFLASDESSFVNGSELVVDGGAAQI
jgi:NAD(P)-dependent dehydrogenase (short-subunit alcohol dehydrogenase family)